MSAADREELYEAVRRLDAADQALREKIDETTNQLRAEGSAALSQLRQEQTAALAAAEGRLNEGIVAVGGAVQGVRDALTWQNRTAVGAVVSIIVFVLVAYLTHHFGF